jgi:hypothetical protein
MGRFRYCDNIGNCSTEYWCRRSTSRWCSQRCKDQYHKRLDAARRVLADESLRRHNQTPAPPPPATTTSAAWQLLADEAAKTKPEPYRPRIS